MISRDLEPWRHRRTDRLLIGTPSATREAAVPLIPSLIARDPGYLYIALVPAIIPSNGDARPEIVNIAAATCK